MERGAKATLLVFCVLAFCSTAEAQYRCVEGDCINGKGKKVLEAGPGGLEGVFSAGVLVSGKAVFPNGDVFEGTFKDHQLVDGSKRFIDGKVLEGKFSSNVLIDGKITEANGSERKVKLAEMNSQNPRKGKLNIPFQK